MSPQISYGGTFWTEGFLFFGGSKKILSLLFGNFCSDLKHNFNLYFCMFYFFTLRRQQNSVRFEYVENEPENEPQNGPERGPENGTGC